MQTDNRIPFSDWAFSLIESYAKRGTCIRRQAAAVAFDEHNRIVGIGMNGVPRGFVHCTTVPCSGATDPPGDTNNCLAIHAEINMIINSSDPMKIERVFVSTTPCKSCALALANLENLKAVIARTAYADERGIDILRTRGVEVIIRAAKQ